MVDEALLRDTFRRFARALLGEYEITQVLYELTDRAAAILEAGGAGVSLGDDDGDLVFVAATDERMVRAEETQIRFQDGPCQAAYRTGDQQVVDDLTTETRWPKYRLTALDQGCLAVLGVPMIVNSHRVGALNVYSLQPHAWTGEEREVAQLLADMACGYIISVRHLRAANRLAEQLQHALDSRVVIEQAKGVIAARADIDMASAFDRLRRYARVRGLKLREVAREVVEGGLQVEL